MFTTPHCQSRIIPEAGNLKKAGTSYPYPATMMKPGQQWPGFSFLESGNLDGVAGNRAGAMPGR
ncbi:MAG: hypothetical protein ACOZF0_22825 [Thermodesulfobacteriota bacterium]